MKTLLLTGGTGYIGSHNAVLFLEAGYNVIILDNLSNSSEDVVGKIKDITGKTPKFYNADIRNKSDIEKVFSENKIDGVIHFAGLKAVGESCEKPYEYYENNVVWSNNLFEVMDEYNCKNIIFSSSATVYDPLENPPFTEKTPTGNTTNPYGTTKFIIENMLRDLANHRGFKVANLRYFNPVGAHSSGLIWEDPNDIPNNLLPYIMKVASWELKQLSIYWDDYDTIDGTWVRDYVHVVDLADAHLKAWEYIITPLSSEGEGLGVRFNHQEGWFEPFNIGTWSGISVKEMIQITEDIIWKPLPNQVVTRRAWDIASAYCSPEKAKSVLSWQSKYSVKQAISDSWNFIQNTK